MEFYLYFWKYFLNHEYFFYAIIPTKYFHKNSKTAQQMLIKPINPHIQHKKIQKQYYQMALSQLALLTILISTVATLATVTIPYNDPNIDFHGRYYTDENGLRFDWPCSSIQFCFVNTSKITWVGSDSFGHYKVILNDKTAKQIIPKKSSKIIIYENTQSKQTNCIKIMKITEDHFGPLGTKKDAIFKSLQLQGNGSSLVKKQDSYKYQLQFIGDSITSAFGVMSSRNPICLFRMRHNQDCSQSWAAHLSAKLNASYRVQAQSGKGVAKNQVGTPGATMSVMYSKITGNSKPNSYYYQDKYQPDAIIFALGDNDYASLIKPTQDYFVLTYSRLMSRAAELQHSKKPKIITICNVDSAAIVCQSVKQAVKSFRYSYNDAYYIEVPQGTYIKQNMGCIGHLNVKGQIKMADSIYEKVKAILEA